MTKGFSHARLACGCRIGFRQAADGGRLIVVIDERSSGCPSPQHVRNLPLYDYREALRPPTRLGPSEEGEFEEEG